jgi:hypothetical protein
VTRERATFETTVQIARWAALGDVDALLETLAAAEASLGADALVAALAGDQLGQLVRQTVARQTGGRTLSPTMAAVMARLRPIRVDPSALLEAYVALADDLAGAGIPVVLLKGAVLAQLLYGDLARRPQYDIDLLVRGRDARRARSILQAAAYRRLRRDSHSISLARGAVHVDLHHALRSSPAYAINEDRLWTRARSVHIAGHDVRTLAHDDTLAFLAMSLTEDIGFGMQKLKNLCDIWLLARRLDGTVDWDEWLAVRSGEHTGAVVANGCAIALDVLGRAQDAPNLARALAQRRRLYGLADRARSLALMSAARGDPGNMAWFGQVYPGSMLHFRVRTLVSGWPETGQDLRPGRLVLAIKARRTRRRPRSVVSGS